MLFEVLWIITSLFFLSWAAYQDLRNRIVQDRIWLFQFVIGIILFIVWFNEEANSTDKLLSVINIIMTFIFAFAFFYFGAFGGADSKCLMVLSINTPIAFSISYQANNLITPYPSIMFLLFNLILLFLSFAIFLFIFNLFQSRSIGPLFAETNGTFIQKINVIFSSYRVRRERVSSIKFHDPAEILEANDWKLHTPVFEGPLDDEEFEKREKEMMDQAVRDVESTDKKYLWMRPQPPGIVFILIAHIIWIFYGSPFISILRYYEQY